MGFYGNIRNTTNSSFKFDRIYSNRTLMEQNEETDGIFGGRFVLVEYDQGIGTGENPVSDFNFCVKTINLGVDSGKIIEHYNKPIYEVIEGNERKYYLNREITPVLPTDPQEEISEWIIDYRDDIDDNRIEFPAPLYTDENGNIIDNHFKVIPVVVDSEFVEGETYLDEDGILQPVIRDDLEYRFYDWYEIIQRIDPDKEDNYSMNYTIDKYNYGNGRGYDSTVWRKVFGTDGKGKYVMLAELNSVVPTFAVSADAPSNAPYTPHFDEDSTNVYYELHMQAPWGFRIAAAGDNYPRTEGGLGPNTHDVSNSEYNYLYRENEDDEEGIVLSDSKATYIEDKLYNGQVLRNTINYDGAIYFNKPGFNFEFVNYSPYKQAVMKKKKTQDYYLENNNFIRLVPTGISGNMYNKHTEEDSNTMDHGPTQEVQNDIQELGIILPIIGDTVAEMWDIIYGTGRETKFGIQRQTDMGWDDPNHPSDDFDRRLHLVPNNFEWKYAYSVDEKPVDYDPNQVTTLAGSINSVHDLMGMIITQDKMPDNAEDAKPGQIYFNGANYNETTGKYDPINPNFDAGVYYYPAKSYGYEPIDISYDEDTDTWSLKIYEYNEDWELELINTIEGIDGIYEYLNVQPGDGYERVETQLKKYSGGLYRNVPSEDAYVLDNNKDATSNVKYYKLPETLHYVGYMENYTQDSEEQIYQYHYKEAEDEYHASYYEYKPVDRDYAIEHPEQNYFKLPTIQDTSGYIMSSYDYYLSRTRTYTDAQGIHRVEEFPSIRQMEIDTNYTIADAYLDGTIKNAEDLGNIINSFNGVEEGVVYDTDSVFCFTAIYPDRPEYYEDEAGNWVYNRHYAETALTKILYISNNYYRAVRADGEPWISAADGDVYYRYYPWRDISADQLLFYAPVAYKLIENPTNVTLWEPGRYCYLDSPKLDDIIEEAMTHDWITNLYKYNRVLANEFDASKTYYEIKDNEYVVYQDNKYPDLNLNKTIYEKVPKYKIFSINISNKNFSKDKVYFLKPDLEYVGFGIRDQKSPLENNYVEFTNKNEFDPLHKTYYYKDENDNYESYDINAWPDNAWIAEHGNLYIKTDTYYAPDCLYANVNISYHYIPKETIEENDPNLSGTYYWLVGNNFVVYNGDEIINGLYEKVLNADDENNYVLTKNENYAFIEENNNTLYRFRDLYITEPGLLYGELNYYEPWSKNLLIDSDTNLEDNVHDYEDSIREIFIEKQVQLGRRYNATAWKPLKGFARDFNTIHGLILRLNEILQTDDPDIAAKTRESSTVQGALNQIHDIVLKFDDLVPNSIAGINRYGKITPIGYNDKNDNGESWVTLKPTIDPDTHLTILNVIHKTMDEFDNFIEYDVHPWPNDAPDIYEYSVDAEGYIPTEDNAWQEGKTYYIQEGQDYIDSLANTIEDNGTQKVHDVFGFVPDDSSGDKIILNSPVIDNAGHVVGEKKTAIKLADILLERNNNSNILGTLSYPNNGSQTIGPNDSLGNGIIKIINYLNNGISNSLLGDLDNNANAGSNTQIAASDTLGQALNKLQIQLNTPVYEQNGNGVINNYAGIIRVSISTSGVPTTNPNPPTGADKQFKVNGLRSGWLLIDLDTNHVYVKTRDGCKGIDDGTYDYSSGDYQSYSDRFDQNFWELLNAWQ